MNLELQIQTLIIQKNFPELGCQIEKVQYNELKQNQITADHHEILKHWRQKTQSSIYRRREKRTTATKKCHTKKWESV